MGDGGWKKVTLDSNKEGFVQIKSFLYVKKAVFEGSKKSFERAVFWL